MINIQELTKINERADLCTRHPDALPWPQAISDEERSFYANVCGFVSGGELAAVAYVAKELAQLADIERHVSVCLGLLCGQLGHSRLLQSSAVVNACMHFAAEEYQHSNMFYRYVELLAGKPLDASHKTLAERVTLYQGPESVESKLVALLGSAYPGESIITIFEHRLKGRDPRARHFLTKMIQAHGLDEARHVEFDHFIFENVLKLLSDAELQDAQRIYGKTMEQNHRLHTLYSELAQARFEVDFMPGNVAASVQLRLTQAIARSTLSGREFARADDALSPEEHALLRDFAGVPTVHPPQRRCA